MATLASAAITKHAMGKWDKFFAQITSCVQQEACNAKSKALCLRVIPRTLQGEKPTIELNVAQVDFQTAPLQQQDLSQVVEEINTSCKQSLLPHIAAIVGLLMLAGPAVGIKFIGKQWAEEHDSVVMPLIAVGFLLILCTIVARAVHDRGVAIRLHEKLSELNNGVFAQQNIRFDLFTWRYLMQWYQQQLGSRATKAPCCACFNPANPSCYNLAQYVLVIQEIGPRGCLLGEHGTASESGTGSTMAASDADASMA